MKIHKCCRCNKSAKNKVTEKNSLEYDRYLCDEDYNDHMSHFIAGGGEYKKHLHP